MPSHTDAHASAPRRCFSPEARDVLQAVTYRYPVRLSYILDDAGDEVVGLIHDEGDSHGVAIAYPIPGGFLAEDGGARLLGSFRTAEALRDALLGHLGKLFEPMTLH